MGRRSRQKQQRRTAADPRLAASHARQTIALRAQRPGLLPQVTGGRAAGFLVVAVALLQGLFFSEQRVAAAGCILVIGVWWFLTHPRQRDWDGLEVLLFSLATVAVLSFLWAANRENAVLAMAVWASAFVLYAVVRREGPAFGRDLIDGALAGAALLLLVGMVESVHLLNILQWNLAGRLTLGLQYPDMQERWPSGWPGWPCGG